MGNEIKTKTVLLYDRRNIKERTGVFMHIGKRVFLYLTRKKWKNLILCGVFFPYFIFRVNWNFGVCRHFTDF